MRDMSKWRFTKALARADRSEVTALSADILKSYRPVIVKEPAKTLAMIKLRDPVKQGLFYIGEAVVCEASVEIDGVRGASVLMGDDVEKTLDMAIIDAAANKGVFDGAEVLAKLEEGQNRRAMQEHAMNLKTTVNFESMDQEAPDDLAADKKA